MSISGVYGKSVTLIWTNNAPSATSGPASAANVVAGDSSAANRLNAIMAARKTQIQATMANPPAIPASQLRANKLMSAAYAEGDARSWYESIKETRLSTTLRKQANLSNGQKLNLWVQDSEWGNESFKVTQAMVDTLATRFAKTGTGIFDLAIAVAGQPWGATKYTNLISPNQDINIVVTNFVPDNRAGGLLGYFDALNNFLEAGGAYFTNSNEALVFFVDSESLASPSSSYQEMIVSTLAHEFTHMINFYQRYIFHGVWFETWLEEISAMMMEDLLNPKIVPATYNSTLQSRIPGWLGSGINNCSLTDYIDSTADACFSYNIGGSYGAFLLRQYGLSFYQALLASTESDSITALDKAIKTVDSSSGFVSSLKRWGAAIALLDSSALPSGYGYPKKTVWLGATSWDLPAISGPMFMTYRRIATSLPSSMKPYAYSAQTFTATSSTFTRTVTIPAGTTLTVVVN